MKILGPKDIGKGILVEWDAGIVNPNEPRNKTNDKRILWPIRPF
jgi:hypothetical protein